MVLAALGPSANNHARELLLRDPVAGGLIHSLLLRHGWGGKTRYWGLWPDVAGTAPLVGLITLDGQGRSTICGGGPAWVEPLAALLRGWLAGAAGRFASFDAPADIADALAAKVPPRELNPLEILAYGGAVDRLGVPCPAEFGLREAAADDVAALTGLYGAEDGFGWVDVPGVLDMCRDGHRRWLVGVVGGEIVAAGWGNTLEPQASRISGIVTRPDRRGCGYATALTAELTQRLVTEDRRPYLYVAAGDPAANALYRKLGYRYHSGRVGLIYEERR